MKVPERNDDSLATGFWAGQGGVRVGFASVVLTLSVFVAVLALSAAAIDESGRSALATDFISVWAAARMAIEGAPLDAFDLARQADVQGVEEARNFWLYPPGYLLLVTPLGALPYLWAWAVYGLVSLAAVALAARLHVQNTALWLAAGFAPAYLPALLMGQTSLLWSAALMAALAALRRGRPWLGGLFLGLMTLKPQLGLTLPVALLATGAWRMILAAGLAALLVAAVPTALYGLDYWPLMMAASEAMLGRVTAQIAGLDRVVSLYAAALSLGLAPPAAMAVHWAGALAAAAAVWTIWRSRAAFTLKSAALCLSVPLVSPYLWNYETAVLAPAALFMALAGMRRWRALGWALSALYWAGAVPLSLLHALVPAFEQRVVILPAVALGLLWCLVQPRDLKGNLRDAQGD